MTKNRLLIVLILSIFIVGMVLAPASASHTFKKGKYKATVSDYTYNQIKKGNKVFIKKVGYKKVTKWTTKKMKTYETWIDSNGYLYKSKSWNPYKKFGYNARYIKSVTRYYDDGEIEWEWYKVPKTVKKPVYLVAFGQGVGDNPNHLHYTGKVIVSLQYHKYLAF